MFHVSITQASEWYKNFYIEITQKKKNKKVYVGIAKQ